MLLQHPIRPASLTVIIATIVTATLCITLSNYFLFSQPDSILWEIQKASNSWLNANLLAFLPLTLAIVVGLIIGIGKLRPVDLGLGRKWLTELAVYLIVGWGLIQFLAVLGTVLSGQDLRWHGAWEQHGIGAVLGFLAAMVFGTAIFEDAVFRGFLLPQFYLRLSNFLHGHVTISLAALLSCALIFALWHLPTLLLNRDLDFLGMIGALGYMLLGGIMLGLLFMRTGKLAMVVAGHALVNAPTLLVVSPLSGSLLAGLVGFAAIAAGPLICGRKWNLSLIQPVATTSP